MPKYKQKSKAPALSARVLPLLWKIILTLGGVGGVIGIILAVINIQQTEHYFISQDNSYATQVALQLAQLSVLQEMATRQAQSADTGGVNFSPTATAFAQQIAEMQSTLESMTTPPVVATSQASQNLDIVFVFDTSASLALDLSYIEFQSVARNVLAEVRANSDNRIGIISFSANAEVIQILSNDFTGSESLITKGVYTDFGSETATFAALNAAYEMLIGQERANTKQAIILFTDGVPYQSDRENAGEFTFKIADIIKSHNIKIASVLPNIPYEDVVAYSSRISSDGLVFFALEIDIRLFVETLLK